MGYLVDREFYTMTLIDVDAVKPVVRDELLSEGRLRVAPLVEVVSGYMGSGVNLGPPSTFFL